MYIINNIIMNVPLEFFEIINTNLFLFQYGLVTHYFLDI